MKFQTFQQGLFVSILIGVSLAFIWLIHPYSIALFWGIVLALIFYPLRNWYVSLLQGRIVGGVFLTILTLFAGVFVPLYILTVAMSYEVMGLYSSVVSEEALVIDIVTFTDQYTSITDVLGLVGIEPVDVQQKISSSIASIGKYVAGSFAYIGQQTLHFLVQLFIMLYALFYFLKDGEKLLKILQHLLPLGDKRELRLYDRFASTVRATVKGTFIIGVIQGVLGGILFWLVGIPGALLWGAIMTVLSIIPAVGSGIIWLPAGIILLIIGDVTAGLIVLGVGFGIISLIDNLLRPPLVGKDTEMPDILVLLSTLGGLSAFGLSGFIIGPIIAAFFLSFWRMFGEEYAKDLSLFG